MAERKQKREEPVELDPEEMGYELEPTQVEVGSGYTVNVSYDENDKPVVNVKTYGVVDAEKIHREITRLFPNARINQSSEAPSVTIVRKTKAKHRAKKK